VSPARLGVWFWRAFWITAVICGAIVVTTTLHAAERRPAFHPLTIAQITADNPAAWRGLRTHVEVTGFVTYKAIEEDGDVHLRICDSARVKGMDRKRCIVAELIPALPLSPAPKVRQHVWLRGIYRFDGEHGHGWAEVHPVLWWRPAP
jgi:hypothetical protein